LIRFSTRDEKRSERGFVLVAVLLIAFLYFALIQLMLWESSQAFRGAQRFRSRVIAQVSAENAAELAATGMVIGYSNEVEADNEESAMEATYNRLADDEFEIDASAESTGVAPSRATVRIEGRINGSQIRITRTIHSQ